MRAFSGFRRLILDRKPEFWASSDFSRASDRQISHGMAKVAVFLAHDFPGGGPLKGSPFGEIMAMKFVLFLESTMIGSVEVLKHVGRVVASAKAGAGATHARCEFINAASPESTAFRAFSEVARVVYSPTFTLTSGRARIARSSSSHFFLRLHDLFGIGTSAGGKFSGVLTYAPLGYNGVPVVAVPQEQVLESGQTLADEYRRVAGATSLSLAQRRQSIRSVLAGIQ